jgi:hypothetical protein
MVGVGNKGWTVSGDKDEIYGFGEDDGVGVGGV